MTKRLYRSQKNKMIGGVAGGLGDYLNIDPILVRVIFIIALFLNGTGLLLYIILWIVVPQEIPDPGPNNVTGTDNPSQVTNETANSTAAQSNKSDGSGRVVTGLLLIGFGILFLIDRFFPHFDFGDILPFLIIVLGIALILNSLKTTK